MQKKMQHKKVVYGRDKSSWRLLAYGGKKDKKDGKNIAIENCVW